MLSTTSTCMVSVLFWEFAYTHRADARRRRKHNDTSHFVVTDGIKQDTLWAATYSLRVFSYAYGHTQRGANAPAYSSKVALGVSAQMRNGQFVPMSLLSGAGDLQ